MSDKQIDIRIRATNETGAATAQAASDMERFAQRTRDASGATSSFGQQASEAFGRVREAITGMIAAYVGVQSVQAFVRLSDEAALAKARLEQVTGSTEKAAQAQQALYDMAQRLQAPFKEVQQVFTRLMPAVEQLKGGAREATALSEIIVTTAKIAGASAAEAASSAQQFAQALGSGVLQGDELKSILENNQVLSRTLADALGVTVGELKKMGEEGKLTADVVGNALLGRFDEIKEKGKELPTTVGGAFTKVTNAVHMLISAMDASNGPLRVIIDAFEAMAEVIDLVCQELKAGQDETDKLGSRQEVVRALGRAFAWVADVVSALIGQIRAAGQAIGGLFAAANAAMQGNFSGAVDVLKDAGGKYIEAQANFVKAVAGGGKIVQAHAARAAAAGDAGASQGKSEFKKLEGGGAAGKDAKGGAKRGGRGSGGSDDVVGRWRQELEAQKLAHAEQQREAGTHHKFRLEQEADFWREKLKLVAASSKEGIAARQAIVAIERQTYQERKQIAALEVSSKEAALQSELDMASEQAEHALEMGRITGEQRLELQIQFEEQRYQIAFQAWEERRKLLELEHDEESVAMKQHHEKLLEMQRRHQLRLRQLQNQMQEESDSSKSEKSVFGSMEKSMSTAFTAILTRTQSFRQAMQNMFKSIGSVFIDELVSKPLAGLIMRQVRESAIWQAIFGQQIAGQAAASATTTGMKTAETTASVTMDATQAAAGAAKSQAGIPYVGPVLAAAAMAAMLAMVLGLLGGGGGSETTTTTTRIPSAAGGWDIPAGINPLTQLHEREMVLPAEQADAVRRMASGGDMGQQPIVINATGGDWVHKNDIVKLLRTLRRDYRLR